MVNLKAAQQRSIGAAAAHCRATGIDQFDDRRILAITSTKFITGHESIVDTVDI